MRRRSKGIGPQLPSSCMYLEAILFNLSAKNHYRGTSTFPVSRLLRIIIICGTNRLVLATDPTVKDNMTTVASFFPLTNKHTSLIIIALIALVLVTLISLRVGQRVFIRFVGKFTRDSATPNIQTQPEAAYSTRMPPPPPITYPPPLYLGSIYQHSIRPAPILDMLNTLTAVPQDLRMQLPSYRVQPPSQRCPRPDLTIALLSLLLTFVGTVIGGIALLYTKRSVSES